MALIQTFLVPSVTFPGFPQRPDNRNVIPTTSQCDSHLTDTVLGKNIPNTSALPNDHVYNDIILRLNSYPVFHSYCKKFILVIYYLQIFPSLHISVWDLKLLIYIECVKLIQAE